MAYQASRSGVRDRAFPSDSPLEAFSQLGISDVLDAEYGNYDRIDEHNSNRCGVKSKPLNGDTNSYHSDETLTFGEEDSSTPNLASPFSPIGIRSSTEKSAATTAREDDLSSPHDDCVIGSPNRYHTSYRLTRGGRQYAPSRGRMPPYHATSPLHTHRSDNYDDLIIDNHENVSSNRPSSRYFRGGPHRSEHNINRNFRAAGPGGGRNSRTWVSPEAKQYQEFIVVRNAMRRLFKNSELAQWKHPDYVAHRKAIIEAEQTALRRKVEQKELEERFNAAHIKLTNWGQRFWVNRRNISSVLFQPTIWCINWQEGKDEIAPWPSPAEMKWEGDDRAKTGVGRFLPLPREVGAPGIAWNQLQVLPAYPFDEFPRIPTLEDVYAPTDEIPEEIKYDLIEKSLEEAIEASCY